MKDSIIENMPDWGPLVVVGTEGRQPMGHLDTFHFSVPNKFPTCFILCRQPLCLKITGIRDGRDPKPSVHFITSVSLEAFSAAVSSVSTEITSL